MMWDSETMERGKQEADTMWSSGAVQSVPLEEIGEYYSRYRMHADHVVQAMENSLRRYGQISPVVICFRDGAMELVDGFKRLSAARNIDCMASLTARFLELDDRAAKAAIYSLNRIGTYIHELEEAWLVYALVREDGLSQLEAAELLGRHKSWVCRRLAMLERLCPEAKEDLKLGLLSPTAARQFIRLPAGNQPEMLAAMRRESLSGTELRDVVDAYLGCATKPQRAFVLDKPREALSQARAEVVPTSDPRLSTAGNRFSKELGIVLDRLSRMETWFHIRGLAELSRADRRIVAPHVERLIHQSRITSDLAEEFHLEITRYERGTA
jgi:ParB-like chromosome segregation protein Spo0J